MRPRILTLARHYLPGYLAGGPVRSVANLVERLGDEFEWLIVASDRDLGSGESHRGVVLDAWNVVGKARVFYAGPATRYPGRFVSLINDTPHDLLYLNTFFNPRYSVLPVFARRFDRVFRRPLLLAPRGEFSSGAVAIKSLKKALFCRFARLSGWYRDVDWHASTELESEDIVRVMGVSPSRIHVARNLTAPAGRPHEQSPARSGDSVFRVCFLSRIARKKNLDYALRALAHVRERVLFNIYGPREDAAYWAECEKLADALPPHIRMSYEGDVPAGEVGTVLAQHDLFFLPTRGENFGHVFMEAWSAGVPVLTSDQTPWRHLESQGIGWALPLDDLQTFARILEDAARRSTEQRAMDRVRCLAFARRHALDDAAVEDNRRMFRQMLQYASS